MADDAGEKTEAPTPRRRQEARQKGQVAKSNDLSSALLLLGGLIGLRMFAPRMMMSMMQVMKENLTIGDPSMRANADIVSIVASMGLLTLSAAGPILVVLVIVALISNLVQVGFLLTGQPLQPRLDKISPLRGIARLFSAKTAVQFVMNLLKLALVCVVGYFAISGRIDQVMLAMGVGGWRQLVISATVLYEVGLQLALALLAVAILDWAWQKYKFERDLRMSKQEIKEELRRMEGDPLIRQRRRKMQFAATMQKIKMAVPTADVVVTNPTELAIAIKYDVETMQSPRVVAKGAGFIAQRIRMIAIEHGVPIVERKPLAQALYKLVEIGQEIPEQFYKAVAEILAYVYRLSGRKQAGLSRAATS